MFTKFQVDKKYIILLSLVSYFALNSKAQKVVSYNLYVKDTTVNFTGKKRKAIAINGQIPAPTLFFTEGDTAEIHVHNLKKEEVSIHWHGILLPNKEDGVPYLTTPPIKAGKTHVFKFPVIQSGTFWYHSHTGLQEQQGLYGPIVMRKAENRSNKMKEQVVLLSDWTDIKPKEVMRLLKRNTDWFEIKKKAVQSYGEAIWKGKVSDRVKFDWIRMPGVDISDVYYPQYLMHGKKVQVFPQYVKGDSIKLRIVNGSTATYFWLQFSGGKMKVVSTDGKEIVPVEVDKFLIATAETYDVVIKIPDNGQYELRATAQDIKGYSSAYFGTGTLKKADDIPPMNYFEAMAQMNKMMDMMRKMGMKMRMGISMKNKKMPDIAPNTLVGIEMPMPPKPDHDMEMGKMDMHTSAGLKKMVIQHKEMMKPMKLAGFDYAPGNKDEAVLSYDMLKTDTSTELPSDRPWREIHLTLSGNMLRYIWSINGRTLARLDEKVKIHKGENVRIYFTNATMMEHPMHLHGHFFRVVNQAGAFSPMKHTVNVNPMAQTIIEFAATEEMDWFLHCHTLYHLNAGMATVISYVGTQSPVQKEFAKDYHDFFGNHGRQIYLWASAQIQSKGSFGNLVWAGLKWQASERFAANWKGGFESETYLRRYLDKRQFLSVYIQSDNRRKIEKNNADGTEHASYENLAALGVAYLLPMFIMVDGRIDHTGKLRFQVGRKDIPITTRTRLDLSWNTNNEYEVDLRYVITRNIGLAASYDSDYGLGGGIYFKY